MFFFEDEISLELLGVFKLKREERSRKSVPFRNYDSLSLRIQGRGNFKTEGSGFSVERGDLLYIPKNALYTQQTSGETVIAIHFINYTFSKDEKVQKLTVEDIDHVEEIFNKMYEVWIEKKQGYRYKCCSMLYELLYFCNCQKHEKKIHHYDYDSRIRKAVNYIHSHFRSENIEISFLADMCSVSETYFRKLFKMYYFVSPKRYIIDLRLETAAQLLQSQLYLVSEVCEKSGFIDPKYFTKLFKSRYGCTPKKYQNTLPD